MREQHYAFIKNNRVLNIAVFASKDDDLANHIMQEQGYDDFVWVADAKPAIHSTYENNNFIPPTREYLIEIGLTLPPSEVTEDIIS